MPLNINKNSDRLVRLLKIVGSLTKFLLKSNSAHRLISKIPNQKSQKQASNIY